MATKETLINIELDDMDIVRFKGMMNKLSARLDGREAERLLRQSVQPEMSKRIKARFSAGGDDTVGFWDELSEATENFRRWEIKMRGLPIAPDWPINTRTGFFKRFIANAYSVNTSGNSSTLQIPDEQPSGIMGKKLEAAQTGNKGKFPARPVIAIGEWERTKVEQLAEHWFEEMIRGLR